MKRFFLLLVVLFFLNCKDKEVPQKPNIVWIMLEDWGYQLSCYGEPGIQTKYIDQLAANGVRYTNSFCTAPVCSPSRSAMMTGFHQNYINANQHRSGKKFGYPKQELPKGIKPLTLHLKEAGYYTALMKSKKKDLNFLPNRHLFDGRDWKNRKPNQPFFAQVTFEWTHRKWRRDSIRPISIDSVKVPPYYPQTDLVKRDWANGLEAMQIVDRQVGELLKRIDDEGLKENTIVFLIGDNGRCMPRGKQFLYDGGIQVPVIIRWPNKIKAGQVNANLISTIDITKTILDIAGVKSEIPLPGINLLNTNKQRKYIYAARDKMDDTHDASRVIRSKEFKLIHNLMPERAYCQLNNYKEDFYPTLAEMNVLYLKGLLNENQKKFMAATKPELELYDMVNDPYELNNLAYNKDFAKIKKEYLNQLNKWRATINDKGVTDEFRKGGATAKYPTRTLQEWEVHLEGFKPWVFRNPKSKMKHPYAKK